MTSLERHKTEQARLVFGTIVLDDDAEHSLVYSASSPESNDSSSSLGESSTTHDGSSSSSAAPTDSSSGTITVVRDRQSSRVQRPAADPFAKIIGTAAEPVENKENAPQQEEPRRPPAASVQFSTKRDDQLPHSLPRLGRTHQRSPLRRDLVKQTQDAINRASDSIHRSIQAPRMARHNNLQHKRQLTSKVRQEWQEDRAAAAEFHQVAHQLRLEALHDQRELSSRCSQARARLQQRYRLQHLQAVDRESQFQSMVYRDHQEALRRERERRRRMSTDAKTKVRLNHRRGEEQLKLTRIAEDRAVSDERHAASQAHRQTQQLLNQQRRRSFAFRNGDAQRIRELHKQLEHQRLAEEHASFQLKWEGEKDAEATQRRMEEERRRSLANRGKAHVQNRIAQSHRTAQEKAADHESYELKWAGERDTEAFQRQLQLNRRKSLELRAREDARQRKQEAERVAQELADAQASIALKHAGERDADEYRKLMERQHRESLARRNREARKQRDTLTQQHRAALLTEHEDYELKWAAERDSEEYRKQQDELRRDSLASRNKEAFRQRQLEMQQRAELRFKDHASFELKWDGERDAEAYQVELRRQQRESLACRNQERSNHAKVVQELQALAREKEAESFALKWAGESDAKAYLARLQVERRLSLQQRCKQVLHHRDVDASQRERELQQAAEDERLRSQDHKDIEAYKQACASRDRASLQYRRTEAQVQRLEQEERLIQERKQQEINQDLESLARSDVQVYINSCKERRRLSLAFRAKEKRRQAEWLQQRVEGERQDISRQVRNRLLDRRYEELARHQERARIAMDAIRHAGCTFNPTMHA